MSHFFLFRKLLFYLNLGSGIVQALSTCSKHALRVFDDLQLPSHVLEGSAPFLADLPDVWFAGYSEPRVLQVRIQNLLPGGIQPFTCLSKPTTISRSYDKRKKTSHLTDRKGFLLLPEFSSPHLLIQF